MNLKQCLLLSALLVSPNVSFGNDGQETQVPAAVHAVWVAANRIFRCITGDNNGNIPQLERALSGTLSAGKFRPFLPKKCRILGVFEDNEIYNHGIYGALRNIDISLLFCDFPYNCQISVTADPEPLILKIVLTKEGIWSAFPLCIWENDAPFFPIIQRE